MPHLHRDRKWILLLLIGALLVRVGWVLRLPEDEASLRLLPDQMEYLELGGNLLRNGALEFYDGRFGQVVKAYRTPGYPALVALCGANIHAIRIAQAILDTSTVLAAYLLARRWLSPGTCGFAAFLVAVNPFLIYFTGLILTETLFITMLAWGMVLLAGTRLRSVIPGIAILALAGLVRPSAMALPVLLVGVRWFVWAFGWTGMSIQDRQEYLSYRSAGKRHGVVEASAKPDVRDSPGPARQEPRPPGIPLRDARLILVSIAMVLLVFAPWAARNRAVLGTWIWTTTNAGITQYDGFNRDADGSSDQSFVARMPELKAMGEVERSRHLSRLAWEYAIANPIHTIRLGLAKIARTWSPVPLSNEYGSQRMYVAAAACYSIPLDLLVIWGLWSGKLSRAAKVYLMVPAIYFTVAHALSVGSLRYRIPAEVPMAVVVASGQWSVVRRKRERHSLDSGI